MVSPKDFVFQLGMHDMYTCLLLEKKMLKGCTGSKRTRRNITVTCIGFLATEKTRNQFFHLIDWSQGLIQTQKPRKLTFKFVEDVHCQVWLFSFFTESFVEVSALTGLDKKFSLR